MHDDLVQNLFTADTANAVWLGDITEHPTAEGKLNLCAIKDVYSGRIVGYSIDSRRKAALAVSALRNPIRLRNPADTVVHRPRQPIPLPECGVLRAGLTGEVFDAAGPGSSPDKDGFGD